ncbi:MAG: flagellar M-ring protein FliF [Gammaproteobacteria bacterium]|nr:flagellar M-ring protein FliF [Gammaproteobacteria bacterium]
MAQTTVMTPEISLMQLLRQAGILLGIAAAVAVGGYVVMWARTPAYTMVYNELSERDMAEAMTALQAAAIPYRVNHEGGALMVPAGDLDAARMQLATAGVPRSHTSGMDGLGEEQSFGTSQFIEQARYQHAIESELSRSVGRVQNVRSARVHLGIPKASVFTRERRPPSASVFLELDPGRRLEPAQVEAIANLVANAIPNLTAENVSIVDQRGNLLTVESGEFAMSSKQLDLTRKIEQKYADNIERILMPIVGFDGVQAQVTATMNFSDAEEFNDQWTNPEDRAVRSEQLMEDVRNGRSNTTGIPGALSNEPPTAAEAPEQAAELNVGDEVLPDGTIVRAGNRRTESVRNFEVNRKVSRVRPALASLERLSVAVVVRNKPVPPVVPGEEANVPVTIGGYTEAELQQINSLVREAIGFDEARGDTVQVVNAEFVAPPEFEAPPPVPLWEQPWVWDVGKQALGGLFVLILVFGVLRPVFKSLMAKPQLAMVTPAALPGGVPQAPAIGPDGQPIPGLPSPEEPKRKVLDLSMATDFDGEVAAVKKFVAEDPKVAAQVVKTWVGEG